MNLTKVDVDLRVDPPSKPNPGVDVDLRVDPPSEPNPGVDVDLRVDPPGKPNPRGRRRPPCRPAQQAKSRGRRRPPCRPAQPRANGETASSLVRGYLLHLVSQAQPLLHVMLSLSKHLALHRGSCIHPRRHPSTTSTAFPTMDSDRDDVYRRERTYAIFVVSNV